MTVAALHLIDQAARFSRWGRPHAAIEAYRQACAAPLDDCARYTALMGLARSLDAIGDGDGAADICREAISMAPGQSAAYGILALVLMHEDRLDQAAAAAAEACLREDNSSAMPCLAASIALRRGQVDDAIAAISLALSRDPTSQRALALRAIAQGSRDGESGQAGVARHVRISEPSTPWGFPSISAFNRALASEIREHEMLEPSENGAPLVDGARLNGLFALAPVLATAIREMFMLEARRYAASLMPDCAAADLEVRGWANVMEAGAYEKPHIHEGGWISGVYYPQLPKQGSSGGEIEFGTHDLGPAVPSIASYRVSPALGSMIMFPAWLHHSTVPFSGQGVRISVAADILRRN